MRIGMKSGQTAALSTHSAFHGLAIAKRYATPMNAITSIEPVKELSPEDEGHLFRAKFIDRCALVEEWASRVLATRATNRKSTYLFGQKLKAVRDLAAADPSPFRHPKRVVELLDKFQPIAEQRSHLAHSKQIAAVSTDGDMLIIFRPVHDGAGGNHLVLTRDEAKRQLGCVADLVKQICDQSLKA